MKIYRIEKKGRGPFSGGQGWRFMLDHCYGNPRFPCARVDYDFTNDKYIYGVQSIKLLRSWFPRASRKTLQDEGFSLIVYTVPKAHVEIGDSKRQVRFDKAQAVAQHNLDWENIK